jgi:hypothetical protein
MKKTDLKNGMIAVMSDGVIRMVLGGTLIGIDSGGGIPIDRIDADLAYDFNERVMKVYGVPEGHIGADVSWLSSEAHVKDNCTLLWDRDIQNHEPKAGDIYKGHSGAMYMIDRSGSAIRVVSSGNSHSILGGKSFDGLTKLTYCPDLTLKTITK